MATKAAARKTTGKTGAKKTGAKKTGAKKSGARKTAAKTTGGRKTASKRTRVGTTGAKRATKGTGARSARQSRSRGDGPFPMLQVHLKRLDDEIARLEEKYPAARQDLKELHQLCREIENAGPGGPPSLTNRPGQL